ncbi:hypothetical protein RCL1_003043 [Eukaryota sp. TZLM3-RCL]
MRPCKYFLYISFFHCYPSSYGASILRLPPPFTYGGAQFGYGTIRNRIRTSSLENFFYCYSHQDRFEQELSDLRKGRDHDVNGLQGNSLESPIYRASRFHQCFKTHGLELKPTFF